MEMKTAEQAFTEEELNVLRKLRDKAMEGSGDSPEITEDKSPKSIKELKSMADETIKKIDEEEMQKTSDAVKKKLESVTIEDEESNVEGSSTVKRAKIPKPKLD